MIAEFSIEIGLCTDDKYALGCGVCVTSIFENNKNNKIRIHILTDGLSDKNQKRFQKTAKKYEQDIEIHIVESSIFNELPTSSWHKQQAYYRFLFHSILDSHITKLIYLDCDIIVTNDIKELWDMNIRSFACAMAWDQNGDDITQQNRIEVYDTYANSGVMLMNLNYWREHNVTHLCMQYLKDFPERCLWKDQDAINAILHEKRLWFPIKYNVQQGLYVSLDRLRLHKEKHKEIIDATNDPCIIHYSNYVKPWHVECFHPKKDIFIYFMQCSEWKGEKLSYRTSRLRFFLSKLLKRYFKCK